MGCEKSITYEEKDIKLLHDGSTFHNFQRDWKYWKASKDWLARKYFKKFKQREKIQNIKRHDNNQRKMCKLGKEVQKLISNSYFYSWM